MSTIQIKRRTRAQIGALALQGKLLPGEPLLITDEARLAVAESPTSFASMRRYTDPLVPAFQAEFAGVTASLSNYNPDIVNVQVNVGFTLNSAASRLTAQVAGLYFVTAQQLVSTLSTSVYLNLAKNGAVIHKGYSDNDNSFDIRAQSVVELAVGDYVDFFYSGTTTHAWGSSHSSVSAFKIN